MEHGGHTAWVKADLVDVLGNLGAVFVVEAPSPPTPVPTNTPHPERPSATPSQSPQGVGSEANTISSAVFDPTIFELPVYRLPRSWGSFAIPCAPGECVSRNVEGYTVNGQIIRIDRRGALFTVTLQTSAQGSTVSFDVSTLEVETKVPDTYFTTSRDWNEFSLPDGGRRILQAGDAGSFAFRNGSKQGDKIAGFDVLQVWFFNW